MARRLTCFVSAKIVCFEMHVVDLQLALSCNGWSQRQTKKRTYCGAVGHFIAGCSTCCKNRVLHHMELWDACGRRSAKPTTSAWLTWVMRRRMHAQLVCRQQVQEGRLAGIVQTQEQNLGVLGVQACNAKLPHPQWATSTGCDVAAEGAAARGALDFEGDGDGTNQSTTATR
jgi:hypothetical protein